MKLQLTETIIHNDTLLGSDKCTWNTDGILISRKKESTQRSLWQLYFICNKFHINFSGPAILWPTNERPNCNLYDINMELKICVSDMFEQHLSTVSGVHPCLSVNTNEVQHFIQLHKAWTHNKILHVKSVFQNLINMLNLRGMMWLSRVLLTVLHSDYSKTWKQIATYSYHLILAILESSVSF